MRDHSFAMARMQGNEALCLQDGRMQYMEREQSLNRCSKQDFISIPLLVIVAPILKVDRNLFRTFHVDGLFGSDTE